MIEARSLTKVYGRKAAVDGIDFQVKPGVVTGFLGPNGAGKSTTMRMILGLDRPTSGTVTVNGRRYLSLGDHHVFLRLLGIVYYMTAAGLIGMFAGVLVRSAAAAVTSMFGLLLVLPLLADKITPDAVTRHTVPYLPLNLGDEMLHHHAGLSPGAAVAGLAGWVLALAAAAAFSLRVRDA